MHRTPRAIAALPRLLLPLLLSSAACAATLPTPTAADCEHEPVMPAAAAPQPAGAYWLDARRLQWPGLQLQPGERVRLYHAPQADLQARPGELLAGAALALRASDAPAGERWRFVAAGPRFELDADEAALKALLREQLLLVHESADGRVIAATGLQLPGALDDLYAAAEGLDDLGVRPRADGTSFRVWAPTAQRVSLCLYRTAEGPVRQLLPMTWDARTGSWQARAAGDLSGQAYRYLVDVVTPTHGLVRNLVTDPYSVALSADSRRSLVADLASPRTKPAGWDAAPRPRALAAATDQLIYELHVRDFSVSDDSVRPAWRGKFLAFTEPASRGMAHLKALARAGLTDVHLLPVFDFASVPERGCKTPRVPAAGPAAPDQQAAVMALAGEDCFNWGYDPWHFNVPEGSYAVNPLARIVEFRRLVMALHAAGLRVGMDMVYNHMAAAGQHPQSVLDRLVPGYYHRLDAQGRIERSTCCDNTATEHRMMAKLMIDSAALWVREYRIDSMRFDLMGHQPREAMERLQARVNAEAGRPVQLLGEGWNFGEVAHGARFVQASQLSLNGSGIASFSDRGRDAARGGAAGEGGDDSVRRQGWLNGLFYAPNALGGGATREQLLDAADMIRVALAGSLRSVSLKTWHGEVQRLEQIRYGDQPAGFASQPDEVVNYVENHDNQTLFDVNALKLPLDTSSAERARVQMLGAALVAFSQGVAYFHAGQDILRSKSMDRNSYNSGDWFNRLDWSYQTNHFGTGLPPKADNFGTQGRDWALAAERLARPDLAPTPADIAWSRDVFRDLIRIRASTPLFRLRDAAEVRARLSFPAAGPGQDPTLVAVRLDGRGLPEAGYRAVLAIINVAPAPAQLTLPEEAGEPWALHPVQRDGADRRVREQARVQQGRFEVPARSAVVFVLR
ncbi:MAG: DUF3372 domain-containing protein [Roseateles depolymerans]|uniref:DUF3372 domain-containing protein n=1 Tax=Roseateles depolymerans TaxID=76731 RepID=A0A2W5DC08_9BURK|nr:MAG: DUF3372 domain-containing protein [Roseateles depolymerans]